ncbi:murein biosynthesis integral membrane protein MurJ [Candidatus Saccharibacteria bacterium]|nr:murein biosynthesis integral membrane protein MurJ [Candidatus Saccharibacteria bacterium]
MNIYSKLRSIDWSSPRFATLIIAIAYLLSRVFGLVRDRLLASHFGIGIQTDAYTAAFRIPEFIFNLIAAGSLAVSFIPVYLAIQKRSSKAKAEDLYNTLWNFVIIVALIGSAIAFVLTPWLVRYLIAPGFEPATQELVSHLSRIMLATPVLFVLSSLIGAYLQAKRRFIIDSLSGVFYNFGIIVGIVFFTKLFDNPIYGVAWGVVLGTCIQFVIPTLLTVSLGWRYDPGALKFWDKDVLRVVKITVPRILATATDQVILVVQNGLGSYLATGSIASYYFANNLKNVPLGMVGASMSVATFPGLIQAALKGQRVMKRVFERNFEIAIVIVSVVLSLMAVSANSLVILIYGLDTKIIANLFLLLIPGVFAYSLLLLIARAFYALEDTKTPFFVAFGVMIFNIIASVILSRTFDVEGLAIAVSLSGGLQFIILALLLGRRLKLDLIRLGKSILVNGFFILMIWLMMSEQFDFGEGFIATTLAVGLRSCLVLSIYLGYARLMRIRIVNNWVDRWWAKLGIRRETN